jgi:hypothetical protein
METPSVRAEWLNFTHQITDTPTELREARVDPTIHEVDAQQLSNYPIVDAQHEAICMQALGFQTY